MSSLLHKMTLEGGRFDKIVEVWYTAGLFILCDWGAGCSRPCKIASMGLALADTFVQPLA